MISRQKTTVAVLRQVLGLSVEEFGQLIGKSVSTVTKLENGLLKLSEETAFTISQETGVDMHWLMTGNPKEKPYHFDEWENRKESYQKQRFEIIQAQKIKGTKYRGEPKWRLRYAIDAVTDWFSVHNAAAENDKAELALYLMRQFLDGLVDRLGKDDEAFLRLNANARIIDTAGDELAFARMEATYGAVKLVPTILIEHPAKK
jgi:transcriptional regulator with XRE-family HTH domain